MLAYIALATVSFLPVLQSILSPIKPHSSGPSFEETTFSDKVKKRLIANFERMSGTLGFWKAQAERYNRFHRYSLVWITISTISIPFVAQALSADPWSKWFVSV